MKTICLLGSPRSKGNSIALAKHFCGSLEKLGCEVQIFSLNKLNYRGCQGCMKCKTKLDKCALKDDLTEVLDSILDADVLVLATPVYFSDVSSQLKGFIDRAYSFLVPDFRTNPNPSRLVPGKTLVFIQVQARPDEKKFNDIFPRYDQFFDGYHKFKERYLIRCCGVRELGEIESREDMMTLAEDTAKKIMTP